MNYFFIANFDFFFLQQLEIPQKIIFLELGSEKFDINTNECG